MKKSIHFLLGQLCLLLTITSYGRAQSNTTALQQPHTVSNGSISGILIDSLQNKPLEYVSVALLQNGSTQAIAGTLTDQNGRFLFQNLGLGEYELVFSYIGYKTKNLGPVILSAHKETIALEKVRLTAAVTALKEVTVQTLRPTITQEPDKLVVSVAGTAMASASTAFDVLAKSPGVFIDQEGNIQLNGRAGVTVMLDGRLTYLSARDLKTMLEGMSAENIKNIEIITNPSARYDAEGTSGILNINLKKNDKKGINGSAYASVNYNGKQVGNTTGGNLNYKSGRFNSFLNLNQLRSVGGREATFKREYHTPGKVTYFDQEAVQDNVLQGPPSVRVGTDFSLNKQHSLSFMGYFLTNKWEADFVTDTYMGRVPGKPALYIHADNYNQNRFKKVTSNVNYTGKLDTLGTTLSTDLDYARVTNNGFSDFRNFYDSLETGKPILQDFLYTETPNWYNVYAAKVDLTRPLRNGHKLELGAKG
ncbi:MAG: TonB-dependent receptor family protein, partial [Hymenobacteraceae bacterium]|nr:TonB-dependent receptor family protein [Hymenobacteraceae bacterium]